MRADRHKDILQIIVVSYNHRVLGKPADRKDAEAMVDMLQGRTHSVYTGVSVFYREEGEIRHFTFGECTQVHVAAMTREEIVGYVATGESDDKAGAYGIQGGFARYIEEAEAFLEDSMAVVVEGVEEVEEYFEEAGVDTEGGNVLDADEVFDIGDGRYLIVEG